MYVEWMLYHSYDLAKFRDIWYCLAHNQYILARMAELVYALA